MNFFKTWGTTTWLVIFIIVLLFSFMLMIATLSLVAKDNEHDEEYLGYVTKLRLLSQEITQQALQTARGNELGFQRISNARSEYKNLLKTLTDGNPDSGMSGTPPSAKTALKNLMVLWEKGESNLETSLQNLLETQETITYLHKDSMSDVMDELFEKNDTLIETMISAKASPNQIFLATQQLLWLERIKHNLLNDSEKKDEKALNEKAIRQFGHNLSVLMSGSDTDRQLKAVASPEAQAILEEILVLFDKDIKKFFLDNSEEIYKAKRALQEIKKLNPLILERIEKLQEAYVDASKQRFISPTLGNGLAVIVLFLLLIFLYMIIRINKARTQEMEQQLAEIEAANQRNQEAILRLLTEIADLADGDLTVNATVTEDFTGAIADAINFSIEALRDLVIRINRTAEQVTGAAQSTRKTAGQLTKASERLAQQIAKGGQAVIGMATAIKTISAKAKESADVATNSVDIASKGAIVVRDTIGGMDTIRDQIQETSKRIKRLGESAQEIGEIVGLIDDIADQTNILALNAAIQAASAGEAGRGFAVVADEIKRLAERSGNATKQIGALVNTIQGDTNEAIRAMEDSTRRVVEGASIAERGGKALSEIEKVSVDLAGKIENMSRKSQTQAAVASNISGTMTIIQEITTQTSAGTNETAASIDRLAELANELKKSVAGFTLPEDAQRAIEQLSAN